MSKESVEKYINDQKYNEMKKSSLQSLTGPIHPMTKVTGFPAGHNLKYLFLFQTGNFRQADPLSFVCNH